MQSFTKTHKLAREGPPDCVTLRYVLTRATTLNCHPERECIRSIVSARLRAKRCASRPWNRTPCPEQRNGSQLSPTVIMPRAACCDVRTFELMVRRPCTARPPHHI